MKFFYAVIMFLLTTFILFWGYVFLIPTPGLETSEEALQRIDDTGTNVNAFINALGVVKSVDKENVYVFEENLDIKRDNAIFLYVFVAFLTILILAILFHRRNYMLFPMIASVITALVFVVLIWLFTNSIATSIYLDLQELRTNYEGLKSLLFLWPFLFLWLFMIVFGLWYRMPRE